MYNGLTFTLTSYHHNIKYQLLLFPFFFTLDYITNLLLINHALKITNY